MAMVVFSIFCLTKIIKTKLRKMRLEFRIIGSRMGEDLKTPQDFKKKKVSLQRLYCTRKARLPHKNVSTHVDLLNQR